jgi:Tol biopolymer transport system component
LKTVRLDHLRAALLAVAAAGLLAAAGLVVILYAQPSEANYPGKPGKIAFAGYERIDSEIFTIKPDGGGRLQLTDNNAGNYQPAYSPDGKRIAYVGFDGNDSEIYTINASGEASVNSPTTPRATASLTTRLQVSA